MTTLEERMRVQELLDDEQAEIDLMYREQQQEPQCPPCNGNCYQGRECPHAGDDFREFESMMIGICVTMFAVAIVGLAFHADWVSLGHILLGLD